jgi:WD40 repeat protein
LWDAKTGEFLHEFKGHAGAVYTLAWLSNGNTLLSAGFDNTIRFWDINERKQQGKLESEDTKSTYYRGIWSVSCSPDEQMIASAGGDNTVRLWDINQKRLLSILEGHTDAVLNVAFSSDGQLIASKSLDSTVRLWNVNSGQTMAVLYEHPPGQHASSIAFHPKLPILATLGKKSQIIRIWDLNYYLLGYNSLFAETLTKESLRYTTAKLVLVGDSGVGKTGLGWRLAHGEFKEHASTHGQQFWVISDLATKRADGTECEAVLWDLAGQPIYRTTHALFLDDVDLSLLLFDPTNRQDPLQGVEFWLKQLKGKGELPPAALVGARTDRGEAVLTRDELAQFCQRNGITAGYISTSAATGEGLEELKTLLKSHIPWDKMTTTVTTVTFKRVKDYILSLKEQPHRQNVLVSPAELRQQLQATDPDWQFSDAEMMTATSHLATHGYVTILRTSSGEKSILLAPDLLVSLVASIVMQASKHPQALGSLNETALVRGDYPFDELTGLPQQERQILLDAAVLRFLEHNICFRETLGADTLLIFPALIRQKRPLYDDIETIDDVSYIIRGAVENVYAALVVLLGYTPTFTRVNQWQNQAQYETAAGQICGFRQIEERTGEIELILYYAPTTPSFIRTMFQGLFEQFLYQRDVEVHRYPPLYCHNKHLQERTTVIKWLRQGKDFLFCPECGEKVILPQVEGPQALGALDRQAVTRAEHLAQLRTKYEIYLSNIKSFRRDRTAPRCFISHVPTQTAWVKNLISDLREAGVHVLDQPADVNLNDFILLAASPAYKDAWDRHSQTITQDMILIRPRLQHSERPSVIPLLVEGDLSTARPSDLHGIETGRFQDETRYTLALFNLVLTLYAIPFNHPAFAPLRDDLQRQWQQTLA